MMNTEMLSEDKKALAIQEIIEKGIPSPRDRFRKLAAAFRFCLPRYLFFDMGDCIFIGLLAAFIGWVGLWRINGSFLCCSLLFASPFAYMAVWLLTAWKEYRQQMYELKMVCFFDLYQVTALRMLYFSSLNLVLNFLILWSGRSFFHAELLFWRLLGISFSAIFLYGLLLILFQLRGRGRKALILPPFLWIVANCTAFIFWNEHMEKFILELSVSIVYAAAAGLLLLYLAALSLYMTAGKEGKEYAVRQ